MGLGLDLCWSTPPARPNVGKHEGDDAAGKEATTPGDPLAGLRNQVAAEGRPKLFTPAGPNDAPDQEPNSRAHRYHREDSSEATPYGRFDHAPDQQPDSD